MKRRTRRLSQVIGEAKRMAAIGASPKEIADHINVDKSTVTRWIQKGKLKLTAKIVDMPPATSNKTGSDRKESIDPRVALRAIK